MLRKSVYTDDDDDSALTTSCYHSDYEVRSDEEDPDTSFVGYLQLIDRYMEKLSLNGDDRVDADIVLLPPNDEGESDEEYVQADAPQNDDLQLSQTPQTSQLPSYPKQRSWSDDKVKMDPFAAFVDPSRRDLKAMNPVELFELFFDDDIYAYIQSQSEAFAEANLQSDEDFTVSIREIKTFVAILLLSGYLDIPRWRMYWESGTETFNSLVSSSMRLGRFETIKRYLHFADNKSIAKNDKFGKIRPFFDLLNKRFRSFAPLEQNLCIDESICPYFGRHSAKQFIRGKPIRYGFKYWALCNRLGYLIQFTPYQGKGDGKDGTLGVGGSVVKNLISVLPSDNHFHIYGDRFFSSIKIAYELKRLGFAYTGTVTMNRTEKCPLQNIEKKERGFFTHQLDTSTGIIVIGWNDNRPVTLLSTVHEIEPLQKALRWSSEQKKKISIPQPNIVAAYNTYMGGVDRMDQNISNYRVSIKSKKWYFSCFSFGLDAAVHNAWQLHRVYGGKLDYLAFRHYVTTAYLKSNGTPPTSAGRRPDQPAAKRSKRVSDAVCLDGLNHWIEATDSNLRCGGCEGRTKTRCSKCNIGIHVQCFKIFHENK